jgi:hypothetical protein
MQQDHVDSRAEEKSGGAPARAKASPDVTSQARAVLNLQNTAGNRAMAQILAPPAKKVSSPRPALGPVSVQRDELTDAIQNEIGPSLVVNYQSLAQMLVRNWRASEKEPLGEPDKPSAPKPVTDKTKDETGLAGTETATATNVPKVPVTKESLAKRRRELVEREKRLQGRPSVLELESQALERREKRAELKELERKLGRKPSQLDIENSREEDRLTALKGERTEAEKLRKEEAESLRPRTEGEKANAAKRAELDRAKKRKELAEIKRKLSGRLTVSERADQTLEDELADAKKEQEDAEKMRQFERKRKPLNPQGKSLTELLTTTDPTTGRVRRRQF